MEAVKSYSDKLALRWVEWFIQNWEGEPDSLDLREALLSEFPGKISNIVFTNLQGRLSFLYWSLDQKKAKQDLGAKDS